MCDHAQGKSGVLRAFPVQTVKTRRKKKYAETSRLTSKTVSLGKVVHPTFLSPRSLSPSFTQFAQRPGGQRWRPFTLCQIIVLREQ
ncbi:hypothetical protein NPIL_393931 [Nephila pilipes]|uniref:Uncharacterized protein n=1 Tax=Nephila pilipes TaxID=299642 RepID=A0A8X6UL00_NEPPI|nr:hypothetical protein NPIL_393931 [Nephila pilipes]